jgi:hypothetical protein
MKKLGLFLIAAFFVIGFTSCQKAESGAEGADSGTTAETMDPNITDAGNPTPPEAPAKPDYQVKAEEMAKTTASWSEEEFDWGKAKEGDKVTHKFTLTNTGTEDLVLTRVKASCGCTTPSWSQEPIPPGKEGFIDVEFNSAGKKGMQNKTITVTGNFADQINKVLRIKGEIEGKEG